MTACQKYIEKMNCYLDGELPASEISDLLAHLEECPACRARFEATRLLSYELRHLQKEPPPQLHQSIMASIKSTTQKQPRSYFRIFSSLAATAALLLFLFSGASEHLSGFYLFGHQWGADGAATENAATKSAALPEAAARSVSPAANDPNGSTDGTADGAVSSFAAPAPNDTAESSASELPKTASADRFYVPSLETDELFAFYTIATGSGTLPAEFSADDIVSYPEKKQTYIYVNTSKFTQSEIRQMLRNAGYTLAPSPYHLPKTDPSAKFGLIVIFG